MPEVQIDWINALRYSDANRGIVHQNLTSSKKNVFSNVAHHDARTLVRFEK